MSSRARYLDLLVPAVLWIWLFYHLHFEWGLNPQYHYGWSIPFLAILLFCLRWPARPAHGVPLRAPRASGPAWLLLALLFPLRVVEEANPDWRLLSWALALLVIAISFVALLHAGGRRWAMHFAFPVCFALVAVPWPVRIENAVIQTLTGAVAAAAVEIAGWSGIGAYQLGNVIQLHNGFVGVDEACSGVRTLQAAIMVSLFLGDLLRLKAGRRVALLIGGSAWVFACNVVRATTLVIIAANRGLDVLGRWHDTVGTIVLVIGMGGLLAIAWMLGRSSTDSASVEQGVPAHLSSAVGDHPHRSIGVAGLVISIAWLLVAFGLTELWYRAHEHHLVERPAWSVHWPADGTSLQNLPVPDSTRAILRFNAAQTAAWQDPPAVRWWAFFARWDPGRAALQLVRSHSPDICLPAIGRRFKGERPGVAIEAGGMALPFRVYEFEQEGQPLFVFVCIQEDRFAPATAVSKVPVWSARGRLLAAWNGQRNLGQRLLEVAVSGFDRFGAAEEATRQTVREVVSIDRR